MALPALPPGRRGCGTRDARRRGYPLLEARRLDPSGGLLLKNETVNPTGSFKDRPVSVATTVARELGLSGLDRKSTRLNSSHANISYAVFCLKKKKITKK